MVRSFALAAAASVAAIDVSMQCASLCGSLNAAAGKFHGMNPYSCSVAGDVCTVVLVSDHMNEDCSTVDAGLPLGCAAKVTDRSRQEYGMVTTCAVDYDQSVTAEGKATQPCQAAVVAPVLMAAVSDDECSKLCSTLDAKDGKFEGLDAFTCSMQGSKCTIVAVGNDSVHHDCGDVKPLLPLGCPIKTTDVSRQNFGLQTTCLVDFDASVTAEGKTTQPCQAAAEAVQAFVV